MTLVRMVWNIESAWAVGIFGFWSERLCYWGFYIPGDEAWLSVSMLPCESDWLDLSAARISGTLH